MLAFVMIFDLLTSSNAVTFSLVVPDGSISGPLGSSVVLPCTLSPSLDCKQYKISWYRPDNDDIQVLLYEDLKVKENAGNPQYRGRASLVGDLQKGNISLKLENLTLADRGEYVCFVNAYKWYEMASVFTSVTVVGSAPYLSLAEVGDQVNVTCASDGWSPKPTLIWRDKRGKELKNITDNYLKDSEGLVSVRSWLMFSPSDSEWISCSVGLSDQEIKEGRVVPLKILQSGWIAAFIVLLVISVLVISLLICLMFKVWQKHLKTSNTDAEKHLIGEFRPPPCAVCTERELNRADEGTKSSGKINPPHCAVCTERELNRAERGTQTTGPEAADKETGTDKEIQDSLPKKEDSNEPVKGSVSSKNDSSEQEKADSLPKKKDPPEQEKGSVSEHKDSNKKGKDSEDGKNDSPDQEKVNSVSSKNDSSEQEKAGSASGDKGLGTGGETKEWKKMQEHKVSIQPESETNLGVLFKERIRAGQYYWEVHGLPGPSKSSASFRTYQQNKSPASWYVGVISETVMKNQLQLSPQNCWVLHYDEEKGFYVNDPSLTPVPVRGRMYRLGVFIDCEKNTLSFYNCYTRSRLYTFYDVDCTQPLVPVVFPGLKPQYSLDISKFDCVKCDELYQHYKSGINNPGPENLTTCEVQ